MAGLTNNKGKVAFIILVILVLGLAAGGTFYYLWATRPYIKATEAINEGDYATAVSLYQDIRKEEEQLEVYGRLLDYAVTADKQYYIERIDYDDAVAVFELTESVLSQDRKYIEAVGHTELINESRGIFAEAEELFEREEYQAAMDTYALVSEEDEKYYEIAVGQIEVCKEYLITWLDGDYSIYIDAKSLICEELENMGVYTDWSQANLSYPFYVCLELNDDGSGRLFLDMDSFYSGHSVFMKGLEDFVYDYAKQEYGYSALELQLYSSLMGYDSVLDCVLAEAGETRESISAEAILADTFGEDTVFPFYYRYAGDHMYYAVDDSVLPLSEDELNEGVESGRYNMFDVEVTDESIAFDMTDYPAIVEELNNAGIDNPVVFVAN